MSVYPPAAFKLFSKMSHRYFLFVSMVMKTAFPAWVKREYAVSLSGQEVGEESAPSAAHRVLNDRNNSPQSVNISQPESPSEFGETIYRRICPDQNIGVKLCGFLLFTSKAAADIVFHTFRGSKVNDD